MAETFEIVWSQAAVRDLDDILDYLSEEASVDRALELYEELRSRVASLREFPRRCRSVPEITALGLREFRESILPPYRLLFRLIENRVILLGVLDSRRDLEEVLIQRALDA